MSQMHSHWIGSSAMLAVLLAGILTGGCSAIPGYLTVGPIANRDTAELDADQIVDLMRRADFSDKEILHLGTDLRNALAIEGSAKIRDGRQTRAIFVVQGKCVYAAVRNGRNLVHPLAPPSPAAVRAASRPTVRPNPTELPETESP